MKMKSSLVVFLRFLSFFPLFASLLRGNDVRAAEADLVFTSPRKIRMLLQTERALAQTIDEYIASERNRLREIQEYAQTWKQEHEIRAADKFKYLANPLNKYHLIKKLTLDWKRISEKMKRNEASTFLQKLRDNSELLWPNMNDWEGVQDSILNIQFINRFKATDLSNGKIGSITTNVQLSFDECVTLMKRSEQNYNYNLTMEWASASVLKFFSTPQASDEHLTDVVRANLISNIIEGNFTNAEHYLNIYSMLKPDSVEIKNLRDLMLARSPTPSAYALRVREKLQNMTQLCSNPALILRGSNLRCRYNHENSPFLRIAPLKQEFISIEPKMVVFRQVLSDSEIETFVNEGKRRMLEGEKTADQSSRVKFEDRLNEINEFIEDSESEVVSALTRRVHDMTGLGDNFEQPWQITLYGAGGFFHEHSDVNLASTEEVETYGKRVATVSIGLNNVDAGGATIFPQLGLKVHPHEGDAIIWFNLLEDGTEDERVRHAACPVVVGYKWELIKRINEAR